MMRTVLAGLLLASIVALLLGPQLAAAQGRCPRGLKELAGTCVAACPGGYQDRGSSCVFVNQNH
jgi:hypothetical protein